MSGHHPAGYVPGLDGLRAASVSIVAFAHFGFNHLIPGGLGVTVFFFLSGYLITRLLMAEQAKHARVDLGRFYGRRFLRLAPELLAFLLFTALLAPPLFGVRATPEQLLAGLFYVTNYVDLLSGPACANCAVTGHLWSLAVEEHFYLIMPARPGAAARRSAAADLAVRGRDPLGPAVAFGRGVPRRRRRSLHLHRHRKPHRLHRLGVPRRRAPGARFSRHGRYERRPSSPSAAACCCCCSPSPSATRASARACATPSRASPCSP
jgi:hypothetical protein